MGIDRYDLYVDEYEHEPDLHYHECGDWVRFEDHEQVVADLRAELAAKSKEVQELHSGIAKALDEIEDAGPKALKYAAQELRTALGEGNGR